MNWNQSNNNLFLQRISFRRILHYGSGLSSSTVKWRTLQERGVYFLSNKVPSNWQFSLDLCFNINCCHYSQYLSDQELWVKCNSIFPIEVDWSGSKILAIFCDLDLNPMWYTVWTGSGKEGEGMTCFRQHCSQNVFLNPHSFEPQRRCQKDGSIWIQKWLYFICNSSALSNGIPCQYHAKMRKLVNIIKKNKTTQHTYRQPDKQWSTKYG